LVCDLPYPADTVGACQEQVPHAPDEIEARLVDNDRPCLTVVSITERCEICPPAHLDFLTHAAFHVHAQRVDVVFGLAEHDLQHERALWAFLEAVADEFHVLDHVPINEVHDPATIDRIARKAVGVPGDDAVGFATFDAADHLGIHGPAWRLGAHLFFE